jgi:hypothetical protein
MGERQQVVSTIRKSWDTSYHDGYGKENELVRVGLTNCDINLAVAFARVLEDFGISNKVRSLSNRNSNTDIFE